MAVSTRCWKYLLWVYNVLFSMSGVVLFIVSSLLLYRLYIYRRFVGVYVELPALVLALIGLLTCVLAWAGWRVTSALHRFHVVLYGVCISLIVACELACFIWATITYDKLNSDIKEAVNASFHAATVDLDAYSIMAWDLLQHEAGCCGPSDGLDSDYEQSAYRASGVRPPWSCFPPHSTNAYKTGCAHMLVQHARQQMLLVAIAALGAAILKSTGILCTFQLAASIRSGQVSRVRAGTVAGALDAAEEPLAPHPTSPPLTLPKY